MTWARGRGAARQEAPLGAPERATARPWRAKGAPVRAKVRRHARQGAPGGALGRRQSTPLRAMVRPRARRCAPRGAPGRPVRRAQFRLAPFARFQFCGRGFPRSADTFHFTLKATVPGHHADPETIAFNTGCNNASRDLGGQWPTGGFSLNSRRRRLNCAHAFAFSHSKSPRTARGTAPGASRFPPPPARIARISGM